MLCYVMLHFLCYAVLFYDYSFVFFQSPHFNWFLWSIVLFQTNRFHVALGQFIIILVIGTETSECDVVRTSIDNFTYNHIKSSKCISHPQNREVIYGPEASRRVHECIQKVMLRYAMLCYAMLRFLCYAVLFYDSSFVFFQSPKARVQSLPEMNRGRFHAWYFFTIMKTKSIVICALLETQGKR